MNKTFAKALALLIALACLLSGCNLIEIDPKMQADEDIAKINQKYSKTAASYDGGAITIGEAIGDFNSYYNEMAYMYYYYLNMSLSQSDALSMAEEVLAAHVRAAIVSAKYDEAHSLSDETIAAMEADIQTAYEDNLASAMEEAEGKTEAAKAENARVLLREFGLDYDSYYANVLTSTKTSEMEDILRAEITEVSEEELQAAYEAKLAEQQSLYTDGSSFESAMTGSEEIVCWMPEGYRRVKHILLMPADEIKSAYGLAADALESSESDLEALKAELQAANDDDLQEGDRTPEEIQKEIDAIEETLPNLKRALAEAEQACLDDVQADADAIYDRLAAGESFEALIAEYGEDPGMQNEPTMSRGYYVSAASQNWESNFRDGAMALASVGDYSQTPVVSGSGVHIIQYTADVPAGNVDLEQLRDALTAETLSELQDAHCESTIDAWVEAAHPSYDAQALLDAAIG